MKSASMLVGWFACTTLAACSVGEFETSKGSFGGGPLGGPADEGAMETTSASGMDTEVVTTGTGDAPTTGASGASGGTTSGEVTGDPAESGESGANSGLSGDTEPLPAGCGNGQVDPGEGCDDGNQIDDDACRNDCSAASCGDAIVQPGEDCDDGNRGPGRGSGTAVRTRSGRSRASG